MWQYDGSKRPTFAVQPDPAQESVWDYPRPPALRQDPRTVSVYDGDRILLKVHNVIACLRLQAPLPFIFRLLILISNNYVLLAATLIVSGKARRVTGPSSAMTQCKCLHGVTLTRPVLSCRLKIILPFIRVAFIVLLTMSELDLKTAAFTAAGLAMRSSAHGKVVRVLGTGKYLGIGVDGCVSFLLAL